MKPMIEYHYMWKGPSGLEHKSYELGPPGQVPESAVPYPDTTFLHLEWPRWAWPGGYEIHYYTKDCGVLCFNCANEHMDRTLDHDDAQFCITSADINYEDEGLWCDHCGREIKPAYGDTE